MSERKAPRLMLLGLIAVAVIGSAAMYLSLGADSHASEALDNAKTSQKLQSLAGALPSSSMCRPGTPLKAPKCCSSKRMSCRCSTCA